MYQVIFGAAVSALYAGVCAESQAAVKKRALALRRYLEKKPPSQKRDRKIAVLGRIIDSEPTNGKCRSCR
jgi:hypothetical protein